MDNLIDQLFSRSPLTVINELHGVQTWDKLGVISVDILPDAITATQPVSLPTYTDKNLSIEGSRLDSKNAKVIQPTRLVIKAVTKDLALVESIMGDFADVMSTFSVTSKGIISDSMAIIELDIDFSPENTDSYLLTIRMEQAERMKLGEYDPESPSDESTYGIRVQSPQPSVFEKALDGLAVESSGTLNSFTSSVSGLYNKVQNVIDGVI